MPSNRTWRCYGDNRLGAVYAVKCTGTSSSLICASDATVTMGCNAPLVVPVAGGALSLSGTYMREQRRANSVTARVASSG